MINYIIQVLLFQALFLAVYDFFLQRETFFKWNRVYLLTTPFISFIIPLLKFDKIQQAFPQEYIVQMPTVFLNPEALIIGTNATETSMDYFSIIFYLGITVFSLLFLIRLIKIIKLISSNEIIKQNIYSLVLLKTKQSAFSFFNYIFINKKLLEIKELEIIQHELVHCRQGHSIDLLVFELLKIVLWFNPLIYVYQKRITLLHEYISDAEVVKETDKYTYFNKLLSETFEVESISFTNQFFKHSLIKKRIVMITKERSQKIKQLKYLLIVPLLLGMLIYTSCIDEVNDELMEMESVLNAHNDYSKGKYFDFEVGKTFVGYSLMIGRYLKVDEYTDKEKELHEKFNNLEGSLYDYIVLFDENNERVNWFRPKRGISEYRAKREYKKGEDVPFAIIENAPVFPGCEGTQEELRKCLQENIAKHVNRNFNADLAKNLGLSPGVKRIFVMFKIDKEGNITEAKSRAPHESLADEALRVVNSLPKMIPGTYKGEEVGVMYSLPIAFKIAGNEEKQNKETIEEVDLNIEGDWPFAIIDEVPVFPGCVGTKEKLRLCIQEKITEHVNRNFNSDLAKELNLSSGVKQVFVMFKIDKNGNITDAKARGPHPKLADEAVRVVNSLPKMIPGKQRGENVGVKYSLPIAFKIG